MSDDGFDNSGGDKLRGLLLDALRGDGRVSLSALSMQLDAEQTDVREALLDLAEEKLVLWTYSGSGPNRDMVAWLAPRPPPAPRIPRVAQDVLRIPPENPPSATPRNVWKPKLPRQPLAWTTVDPAPSGTVDEALVVALTGMLRVPLTAAEAAEAVDAEPGAVVAALDEMVRREGFVASRSERRPTIYGAPGTPRAELEAFAGSPAVDGSRPQEPLIDYTGNRIVRLDRALRAARTAIQAADDRDRNLLEDLVDAGHVVALGRGPDRRFTTPALLAEVGLAGLMPEHARAMHTIQRALDKIGHPADLAEILTLLAPLSKESSLQALDLLVAGGEILGVPGSVDGGMGLVSATAAPAGAVRLPGLLRQAHDGTRARGPHQLYCLAPQLPMTTGELEAATGADSNRTRRGLGHAMDAGQVVPILRLSHPGRVFFLDSTLPLPSGYFVVYPTQGGPQDSQPRRATVRNAVLGAVGDGATLAEVRERLHVTAARARELLAEAESEGYLVRDQNDQNRVIRATAPDAAGGPSKLPEEGLTSRRLLAAMAAPRSVAELSGEIGLSVDETRQALRELVAAKRCMFAVGTARDGSKLDPIFVVAGCDAEKALSRAVQAMREKQGGDGPKLTR